MPVKAAHSSRDLVTAFRTAPAAFRKCSRWGMQFLLQAVWQREEEVAWVTLLPLPCAVVRFSRRLPADMNATWRLRFGRTLEIPNQFIGRR